MWITAPEVGVGAGKGPVWSLGTKRGNQTTTLVLDVARMEETW